MRTLPADYLERVYAGVLGKLIGVYLGRPFESWTLRAHLDASSAKSGITSTTARLPLIVTDDDIAGTFTFLRALPDHGTARHLPREIGQTWLNYIVERRAILWWGGVGNSTEHTAYSASSAGSPRRQVARSRSTARSSPSRSARRYSSTAGRWSRPATRNWPPISRGGRAASAMTARRSTAPKCSRRWRRTPLSSDIDRLHRRRRRTDPANSPIARLIADVRDWHAANPTGATRARRSTPLRLRQASRRLPHRSQPRADHFRAALCAGRFPAR